MRNRHKLVLFAVVLCIAIACVIVAAILIAAPKHATAGPVPVYADSVPTTIPAQGVLLDPATHLLLKPTSVDAATLKVPSAAAAIDLETRNGTVKTTNVQAILADVSSDVLVGVQDRICWIVSDNWGESREVPHAIVPRIGADGQPTTQDAPTFAAHGQVAVLDAQSGDHIVGFFLMDYRRQRSLPIMPDEPGPWIP